MNCIVRRVQIQPPEESRWSYKVESKDGNAVLVTKRLDTQGWDTPFELQIQNDVGSVQLITVNVPL